MTQASVYPKTVTRFDQNKLSTENDLLAVEEPLEIRLGFGNQGNRMQKSISVTMRTPGHDFELALGFLFTEGIIDAASAVTQINYCTDAGAPENKENIVSIELNPSEKPDLGTLQRNFYTTSSCGVCGKESIESIKTVCRYSAAPDNLVIPSSVILSLGDKLNAGQNIFEHTGGLHASALFDAEGNLLMIREDVGRHNALDKLIGACAGAQLFNHHHNLTIPLQKHILLLSGRASFELIQKSAMAGICMVCAIGAPSSLAVQMAETSGITLIGFLRQNRFNIYTHKQRLLFN